ncbi:MAG: polyhydroxyalkanoic acid system family protein [Bythopirellula sp.]
MPKINLEIPHTLSAEEARSRLEKFTENLPKDQVSDLEQSWQDNTLTFSFKTFGIQISGDLTAEHEKMLVDLELPFSAMIFKGKIESEMKKQLERLAQ